MSYTKLFSHIVTSSIWSEDDQTRILWITLLALSDKHGEVMASIPGLSKVAGISIEATEKGISKFMSPDQYSRTPDEQGRRLEKIEGGWLIINYAKHRQMASSEDRKAKAAERQRRFREKNKRNAEVTLSSPSSNGQVTPEADIAEAEAEADTLSAKKKSVNKSRGTLEALKSYAVELQLPESDGEHLFDSWTACGWTRNGTPIKDWKAAFRTWRSGGFLPSQKKNGNRNGVLAPPAATPPIRNSSSSALCRAARLIGMAEGKLLGEDEKAAWEECREAVEETTDQEWLALERWYASQVPDEVKFRPQNLGTLLRKWNSAVSRAGQKKNLNPACTV